MLMADNGFSVLHKQNLTLSLSFSLLFLRPGVLALMHFTRASMLTSYL